MTATMQVLTKAEIRRARNKGIRSLVNLIRGEYEEAEVVGDTTEGYVRFRWQQRLPSGGYLHWYARFYNEMDWYMFRAEMEDTDG